MQAVIIDCITIVDPQLASIIRNDAESIMTGVEDPHATCPTGSKVISSAKTMPIPTCIPVVNDPTPTSHVRPAPVQILASSALAKIVSILSEETMAINRTITTAWMATAGARNIPSVSSVRAQVPE
jgi:hypothetical protein